MRNVFYIFFCFLFTPSLTNGQDIIRLENGDSIPATIYKVKWSEIQYHKSNDPELNTQSVDVKDVKYIDYKSEGTNLNKDVPTHSIYLDVNGNTPLGTYKKHGNAQFGVAPAIGANLYLFKNLGISLETGVIQNEVAFLGVKSGPDDQAVMVTELPSDTETVSLESQEWISGYLMLGPVYSFKLKNIPQLTIDTKIQVGIAIVTLPFYRYMYESSSQYYEVRVKDIDNDPFNERIETPTVTALGFNIGGGARWALSRRLSLQVKIDIISVFPRFEYLEEHHQTSQPVKHVDVSYYQPIAALRTGLGISYNFYRKNHK